MQKVLLMDTSILCVWLEVPGKTTCGATSDKWDKARVDQLLESEIKAGTNLILPLAAIIETGNHIAQANSRRYEMARALAQIIISAADAKSPWGAFTEQSALWETEKLRQLATQWASELAMGGTSIGDATIKVLAEYYAEIPGCRVEILTGDSGLKAYEPMPPVKIPRRRSQRRG
jgi:hypothetical protein